MRQFFTVLGCLTAVFALTSNFAGDILRDVINWLY